MRGNGYGRVLMDLTEGTAKMQVIVNQLDIFHVRFYFEIFMILRLHGSYDAKNTENS